MYNFQAECRDGGLLVDALSGAVISTNDARSVDQSIEMYDGVTLPLDKQWSKRSEDLVSSCRCFDI